MSIPGHSQQEEPGLEARWSAASQAGRRDEDFIVAVSRVWPRLKATPSQPLPQFQLFAAFDGHNGAAAARFAASYVVPLLEERLPYWPAGGAPTSLACQLQEALADTFLELQRQFSCTGVASGCTATVVVQVGRLVTVGSLGSSRCVLDTGSEGHAAGVWLDLSREHVISSNARERLRLAGAGCHLALLDTSGSGPALTPCRGEGVLRLWPGGLALSRSIGDFNVRAGELGLLPLPHILQVLLPPSGGRIILATGGVWGCTPAKLIERAMRGVAIQRGAHDVLKVLREFSRDGHHHSPTDASIIIVDVLQAGDSFQSLCRRRRQKQGGAAKSLRRALRLLVTPPKPRQPPHSLSAASAEPQVLADFDCAALLGLVPEDMCRDGKAGGLGTRSLSRNGSWERVLEFAGSKAAAAAAATKAAAAAAEDSPLRMLLRPPSWCNAAKAQLMLAAVVDAHQLWAAVRQQQRADAAAAAATAAAVAEWQAAAVLPGNSPRVPYSPQFLPYSLPSSPAGSLPRSGSFLPGLLGSLPHSDSSLPGLLAGSLPRTSPSLPGLLAGSLPRTSPSLPGLLAGSLPRTSPSWPGGSPRRPSPGGVPLPAGERQYRSAILTQYIVDQGSVPSSLQHSPAQGAQEAVLGSSSGGSQPILGSSSGGSQPILGSSSGGSQPVPAANVAPSLGGSLPRLRTGTQFSLRGFPEQAGESPASSRSLQQRQSARSASTLAGGGGSSSSSLHALFTHHESPLLNY